MRIVTTLFLIGVAVSAAYPQDKSTPSGADSIAWGEVINGLQLGISPQADSDGIEDAVSDGSMLRVRVHLRNTGKLPVRLLASVHTCLAMGPEFGSLLITELRLKPQARGDPLIVTYQGCNHLWLLDKRRPKLEPWQETLSENLGKHGEVQLNPDDVEGMTMVLAPGESAPIRRVDYTPGKDSRSAWRLAKESNLVPEGKYQVSAVLVVDHEFSEWKGKLTSGSLEVELHQQDKHSK